MFILPSAALIDRLAISLFLALLAMVPVSSKAANLAWIALFITAAWRLAARFQITKGLRDVEVLTSAISVLGAFFLAGLLLKVGMMFFWGEPIRQTAFELTATISAGLAWVLSRRQGGCEWCLEGLAIALFVASALAAVQGHGYTFAGHAGPTNAVNWGAGVALLMCVALAVSLHELAGTRTKVFAFLGLLMFSLAIFVAGRRGAFFAILWVTSIGSWLGFRELQKRLRHPVRWAGLGILIFGVVGAQLATRYESLAPFARVTGTVDEIAVRLGRDPDNQGVPVGTLGGRLYLLKLGLKEGSLSPWTGLGAERRDALVKQAESDLQESLFHMHNEYLHAWVAYGLVGLLSVLCFPIGFVWAGWRIRARERPLALALVGLGLVHLVNGVSNVNTFHNYYTTVFAMCVVIPFILLPRSGGLKSSSEVPSTS